MTTEASAPIADMATHAAAPIAQRVPVDNGAAIELRLFSPAGGATPIGAVMIGAAMGVRQAFYRPFAQWLSGQGYVVATFDYRGVGDSRQGALRGFEADLFAWARDTDAAIDALALHAGDVPIYLVGHSLGAQLPGLLRNRGRIAGLVSVASGSGYWRDNAPRLKRLALYFWHVVVPIATGICGYFPGTRLKKVGDLPRGVILQWRRWCLDPRYHVGAEGKAVREQFEAVRFPLVALSLTDDEMMTERGTRVLVGCYPNAPSRIERVAPSDVGARRIGHFGFFRDGFQATLWARVAGWLDEFQNTQRTQETTT